MPAVDLTTVILTALLNPVVIAVAIAMGLQADQWQKVPVAGFAAAVIGSAVLYVVLWLGFGASRGLGHATGGVFVAEMLFGTLWAGAAFLLRRR